ncbi:tubulin monoglutamylase TTLL4 isoform X2 [Aethina tumida]|uniref:tubulin monoglutamylase TTLL4 isoform X2 n=1 Tax=Aethina tumida TaxID=116153 RepID=UPI00096B0B7E|nr:tubulin monoglutamylase TTLL4 isoform X2 [Aethina tumida]
MGDCNLTLTYSCPKTCKYSYSSWCPTCEIHSPRRRSRSETNEPRIECRKKCKDMKTFTPRKYHRSREYENMELEYDVKDGWSQTKDNWCESKDNRVECCRIRSNLCELPTSYISNNCQSMTTKLSSDTSDYVVKSKPLFNDINQLSSVQKEYKPIVMDNKLSPNKIDVLRPHYRLDQRLSSPRHSALPKTRTSPFHIKNELFRDNQNCDDYKNCREYCTLVDLKHHNIQDRSMCYDTSTYFNTGELDSFNLHDKYNTEMNRLKENLVTLKNSSPSIEKSPSDCNRFIQQMLEKYSDIPEPLVAKPYELKVKKPKEKQMLSPTAKQRSRISLKTRPAGAKFSNVKLRRNRPKVSSTPCLTQANTESEGYRSEDDNEPEADLDEADGGSEVSNAESVEDKKDESEETEISLNETGSGDACREWPVRQSLFPYIPPYISFSAHSAEHPTKFPLGGRFFKWKLTTITPILVRQTLTNSGFALVKKSNQWLGTWGKHMKSPMFRTLKETQKINHFPGTFQLGRKDRLWRNFQRLINKFGHKEFGFIPHTYVLPQELQLLKQNWEYKNGSGGEMWIIKPPASARGVGIKVINKWSQLPKKTSLVVQKYIAKPYLINGSKFDLRLYVLVTSFHPLRIYLYPDGLARFASAKYSEESKDLKDRYRHLTNYSINKLSDQYTANEDANSCQGHKWTISKLMEYLQERGVNSSLLWKNLQQLVIKTMISAEAPITQLCEEHMNSLYNCYELFGVDVLLDEDLKPWLLEVNISPSLHSASPLDAHVKGPLVQTLFDMAQFHLPSRITKESQETPGGFVGKIYTTGLMKTERLKHIEYEQYESRSDYLEDILTKLTGDDVRQLTRAEDEFVAKGNFERIFPTENTHKYLQFMEPRYYNRLFDAWETKYSANRKEGIKLLKSLCEKKVHLKAAPSSRLKKNLPSTIPGDVKVQQSKEVQNRPLEEILRTASITNDVTIVCAN